MRFRVWCLSWEDTCESGARDVVSYDPMSTPGLFPKPVKGEIQVAFFNLSKPAEAAEIYADYCHDNRNGHEDKWPLVFRVRAEDGTESDFKVEREVVCEFSAAPCAHLPPVSTVASTVDET